MREAEGDEAGQGGFSDAPEADEPCSALDGGVGRAELRSAEEERRPAEIGPLRRG